MTFVTPWLILGSLAIVIPVAIHLFLRRQPQKIEFPALRFVQQVEQTAKRSLRLRHVLLLLCRIGLIILLSLLLARPSITRSVGASSSAPTAAALLFDTSMRMNCQRDNQSLFDYALKEGQWVLSRLPNGSQIAVIDSQTKTPAFAVDRSAAKYQMEQLKPGPGSLDFTGQIIKSAQVLESSSLGVKELYIFTDMSKAAWDAASAPAVASSLKKANSPAVYVIDVGSQNLINDSVLPLRLEKEILAPGDKLNISAVVKRSASELPDRTLELYVLDESGKPVKRDEKILSSESEQSVSFSLSGFEPGKYEGFVKLSGADAFAEDDCRWFSFERAGAKNVLLITASENQKSSFLTAALSPKSWREEGRSRFNCDVVSQVEFDSESFGLDKMSKYDL
ncbi:MAG: BatA domain-containing protein, partial [Thermoguttaceae bacterium]|nr:BatA domain-containing protein [Thermoguttaceae bacterium]